MNTNNNTTITTRDSKMNKISRNDLFNNNIDFTIINNGNSMFEVRHVNHHDDDNDSNNNNEMGNTNSLTYSKHHNTNSDSMNSLPVHYNDMDETNEF